MHHHYTFLTGVTDHAPLFDLADSGAVRAVAKLTGGPYSTLVVTEAETPRDAYLASEGACPPGVDCTHSAGVAVVNVFAKWIPADIMIIGLFSVEGGTRRQFQSHARELLRYREGQRSGGALMRLLSGSADFAFEVAAHTEAHAVALLDQLLDVPGVTGVVTAQVHPEDQRGFGSGEGSLALA